MAQNQTDELLNRRQSYQQDYSNKCIEWKSEPVEERRLNDRGCIVAFFILTIFFFALGGYQIVKYTNDVKLSGPQDDTTLYFTKYGGQIIGCLGIALVLSFLYIVLVRVFPKGMVYTMLTLSFVVMAALAILGLVFNAVALTVVMLGIMLVYALVLFCFRKKIKIGIVLVKVASKFIMEKPSIFIAPVLNIIFMFAIAYFWIYSAGAMIAVINNNNTYNKSSTVQNVGIALWVLLWLFYSFLFYYIMVFTVAVAASFWYYGVDKNYFTTAYKWIFTSSFGSLVFAALLIALITFARMLINDQRGRTRNIAAAVCLCIMSCLLKMIEDLVKVLNHNAVIVMSVTGESYVESAKTTIGILSRNLPLMTVATIITNLLVFWGVIIICGISSLFGVLFLENAPSDQAGWTIGIIATSSLMMSILVFSVLVQSVSSVYIFYCFDLRFRELGLPTHNMPNDIDNALNDMQAKSNPPAY